MTIPAIKKITVINTKFVYEHNVDGVTEIQNRCVEYPDRIEFIYNIMRGDSLFVEIVNVPVVIEHFN